MSTFAVFGMTRARAVELARKKTPTSKKDPNDPRKIVSLDAPDWETEVQAAADGIMAGSQCVQLSDKYDAPSFAFDYLRLAQRTTQARGLHVKSYGKTGNTNPRTGKAVFEWALVSEADCDRYSKRA